MSDNIGTLTNPKRRYNKIDGWRGYWVPALAVAGSSDTGTYSDSPCPSPEVLKEINRIRKEVLLPAGIKSRSSFGNSSNLFCAKRWLIVGREDFDRAARLVENWLEDNRRTTSSCITPTKKFTSPKEN
jgi:hypothetical protein